MEKDIFILHDKSCFAFWKNHPEFLLLQPISSIMEAEQIASLVLSYETVSVCYCGYEVKDWNHEMSPWQAPAVFSNHAFGNGAMDSLRFIEIEMIPYLKNRLRLSDHIPVILGGYSLAGLFALWCVRVSEQFKAVMAASPSVWFPQWDDFTDHHPIAASVIYLSLGAREEKTKNKMMARVGDELRRECAVLKDMEAYTCILEWNIGNHFQDAPFRCAKGFIWCVNHAE